MDISDTLMYVYEMLGAELLSSLYDKLGRLLTSTEQPSSWQVSKQPQVRQIPVLGMEVRCPGRGTGGALSGAARTSRAGL